MLQPCSGAALDMWLTGRHITSQTLTESLTRRADNSPLERKWGNSSGTELQSLHTVNMNYMSSHHKNVFRWQASCLWSTGGEPCSYSSMWRHIWVTTSKPDHFKEFPLFVSVRCSVLRLKGLLFRHLPILSWLPKYKAKENLLCDVISGVSAGTIQVPQGQWIPSSLWCLRTLQNPSWLQHRRPRCITQRLCFIYRHDLCDSCQTVSALSRHGIRPLGQPPARQRSLLLFLSPHPVFLHGHCSPDGPR